MPKYVSYDEMMEILDNKYLLPFRKDERLRGLNGIDIVRCKDCKYMTEHYITDGNVQYWTCSEWVNETDADGFCSYGERRVFAEELDRFLFHGERGEL